MRLEWVKISGKFLLDFMFVYFSLGIFFKDGKFLSYVKFFYEFFVIKYGNVGEFRKVG